MADTLCSCCAVNLAVALARNEGLSVGLMDADVYGPSIPRMMALEGEPRTDASALRMHPSPVLASVSIAEHLLPEQKAAQQLWMCVNVSHAPTGGRLYPLQNFGVKCMSMGFLMKVQPPPAFLCSTPCLAPCSRRTQTDDRTELAQIQHDGAG